LKRDRFPVTWDRIRAFAPAACVRQIRLAPAWLLRPTWWSRQRLSGHDVARA